MPKVKLTCALCQKEVEREDKLEPKNKIEGRQIRFNCPHCGGTNYRDGSAEYHAKKSVKKPAKPDSRPAPGPDPAPEKEPVKPAVPAPEDPEKRSDPNEETDDSLTVL